MATNGLSVHLVGTGSYLHGEPIDNKQVEALVGPVPEDILEGIQVQHRHWMIDPHTGEHLISNSEMAARAAAQAIERAGLRPADIDLIVMSTASPEYQLPPAVTFVQQHLGIAECATLEIRSGCAGFVEAADIAYGYLTRGAFRNALVVGCEAISPLLVPLYRGIDPERVRMRDRLVAYTFGDGAGALVLRAEAAVPGIRSGVLGSVLETMGGLKKPGMQVIGGATHAPLHQQALAKRLVALQVDVVESGKFIPHMITRSLKALLQASDLAAEDIALWVVPEGNAGYMTSELEAAGLLTDEWLALRDKVYENIARVGATGSAAVPLALDEAATTGRVRAGDNVMLLAIETSKWKYAGMTLVWGSGR
ncbi:3-oxoacyl-ACP synthase III family protein [Nocardia goodfellowii]|uniref:3-oxoacyl-[acyl-carrier-protein] synthase-3 n=1 Tax=Nocardia goodfellowii TaxID=882446 RepID=A0ABS4QFE0_9NOCA|nr:3-oxoacyl-[acyl-carrier-protein] synthase III C-terminal domain-containing protein [Nocardia goodfellowii]MBP2189875.1 3-oxoacyl-[acyl-carrier-protein] synthase-3 [Nocardia goodfellowii]